MAHATARAHASTPVAAASLTLAAGGSLALAAAGAIGFHDPHTETFFTLSWLAGWALLAWATIVGIAATVHIVRTVMAGRRRAPIAPALVILTAAVIGWSASAYPLVGAGAGVG